MAPVELFFGSLGKDGDGHEFFINDKEKLPIIVKPGKRVKKTYGLGEVKLEVSASCSKNDLGGTVEARLLSDSKEPLPNGLNPIMFKIMDKVGSAQGAFGLGKGARTLMEYKGITYGVKAVHKGRTT